MASRRQSGRAPKAQLVSEEIRMLVFLCFGQGDFQTDFCSRLLRSLQETCVHVLVFLFFKLRWIPKDILGFTLETRLPRDPRIFGGKPHETSWFWCETRLVVEEVSMASCGQRRGSWDAFNWSAIDLLSSVFCAFWHEFGKGDLKQMRWQYWGDLRAAVLLRPFCVT